MAAVGASRDGQSEAVSDGHVSRGVPCVPAEIPIRISPQSPRVGSAVVVPVAGGYGRSYTTTRPHLNL